MSVATGPANAVAARFGIPVNAVREVMSLPLATLAGRDELAPLPNCMTPSAPLDLPPGSTKISRSDPECYVGILREVEAKRLLLSEPEGSIRQHPTYSLYLQWAGEGREAPPIAVFEGNNGQWVTCNRRRALVHQELGLSLKAWFEPYNAETGLPLKITDIQMAYQQALQHNPRAAANTSAVAP